MDLFERMQDVFLEEISPFQLRVEILGFKNVGVFGSFKVVFFSREEIVLSGKSGGVKVVGNKLKIARSDKDEIYISGEIESVEKI